MLSRAKNSTWNAFSGQSHYQSFILLQEIIYPAYKQRIKRKTNHFGTLSKLIEYDQRPGSGIADGSGNLVEVNGKGREAGRDAVSCSHACEDLVYETDLSCVSRYIAADVSHEYDQSNLTVTVIITLYRLIDSLNYLLIYSLTCPPMV